MNFPISKIEDVRNLNNLVRLSFSEPTLIVAPDIHNASEEALNAFLKNLEEPQENVYFALTAPSARKVLATIVSRCQIIKVNNKKVESESIKDVEKFLSMTTGQKLGFVDKIKDRNKAEDFVENLIYTLRGRKDYRDMDILLTTLKNIKGNGNINLQLTNLVINM